jgi:hypothetical protein
MNLTYIPKSTGRSSLLTRPRPHIYSKAIGFQNWIRDRSGNTKQCYQDHVRDRRLKADRRIVYILTIISPNIWWAYSRNHHRSAIQTRKSLIQQLKNEPTSTCNKGNNWESHIKQWTLKLLATQSNRMAQLWSTRGLRRTTKQAVGEPNEKGKSSLDCSACLSRNSRPSKKKQKLKNKS